MKKTKTDYMTEGFNAQHTIYNRLANKYKQLSRYDIIESPDGSITDMVDKIDITIIDKLNKNSYPKSYDVKSTEYNDKITYTHINSLGQKSKIMKGDFTTDLIFTFGPKHNIGYFVKAEDFYKVLMNKIIADEEQKSKMHAKSKYVWFTKKEIEALAYDII